ncbi:MAG TPA: ParB N-terminal domain-containing protein [Sphingomonas sp.]
MKLQFLPLDKLFVDKTNMRAGKAAPDVSDILPTIRKRGVLQPLLVRPAADDRFGIVAGSRRFRAAGIADAERRAANDDGPSPDPDPEGCLLPCAILDEGDDAAAIEASLIENVARLDPDEVTQWVTFTRLVKEGRSAEDIAATFGLPDLAVRRILALGNLLPRIRDLYAREEIDRATVRHLTMATKRQQAEWLKLVDDPDAHAPRGPSLKAWLTGGQSIPARVALFDVETSGLATIADLFGEDRYFVDANAFWDAQNAAIAERSEAYRTAGWSAVVIVPPSEYFSAWEYDKTPKRKSGRVYVDVRGNGEVTFHEGYVSRRERERVARLAADGAGQAKSARPEVTSALASYIDLHRHAAVRAALTAEPGVALRMMVAHIIAGSPLWSVRVEPQSARDDATRESVAASLAETVFEGHRRAVLDLLGFGSEEVTVTGGCGDDFGRQGDRLTAIFLRLLDLPDPAVLDVVAVVIGETLAVGSPAVDALGLTLGIEMADWWQADPALFDLIRDKQVLGAMVAEVAGPEVAEANTKEKGAALKTIVADHLAGAGGRAKVERWVPRWLAFPPAAYTDRGGVGSVAAHARVAFVLAEHARPAPDPTPLPDAENMPAPGERVQEEQANLSDTLTPGDDEGAAAERRAA